MKKRGGFYSSGPCWFSVFVSILLVILGAFLIFYASLLNQAFGIAIAAFGVWIFLNEFFISKRFSK